MVVFTINTAAKVVDFVGRKRTKSHGPLIIEFVNLARNSVTQFGADAVSIQKREGFPIEFSFEYTRKAGKILERIGNFLPTPTDTDTFSCAIP